MRGKPLVVVALVLILVGSGAGGYYLGKKTGEEAGYSLGHKAGYDVGYESAPKPTLTQITAEQDYKDLFTKYNGLVDDYNILRNAAINASAYQARKPLTCNTYNYSYTNSSTTSCY